MTLTRVVPNRANAGADARIAARARGWWGRQALNSRGPRHKPELRQARMGEGLVRHAFESSREVSLVEVS